MQKIVCISTIEFDLNGHKEIPIVNSSSDINSGARRATRTATLDGGCVVHDTGFSDSDRSVTIKAEYDYMEWFQYIVQTYRLIHLSLDDGFYYAIPMRYREQNNHAVLDLEITEKIT